ncbi:hypothetical protein FM121_03530 [Vagococcus fluvialis bH819]|uniref:Uncharacterized protein n=1 Tax=Vagococcus fluvialis bH819 TaxID=1255619 RepID=A0A1X6WLD2_9ENTE|nr:hypothetical protein FM121_03530 [Vagococcus fluvialis bH819]
MTNEPFSVVLMSSDIESAVGLIISFELCNASDKASNDGTKSLMGIRPFSTISPYFIKFTKTI